MTFSSLASGAGVFLDANVLVFHYGPHPIYGTACNQLVDRIERQDLLGFTSTHVLTEVAHRLMMIEASALTGTPSPGTKRRLQQQPAHIQKLTQFQDAVRTVLNSRMQVLTIGPSFVLTATAISKAIGLLSSDALIVAVMQAHSLTNIA